MKKDIRLIELFAGIGAQAKALENLRVDFEHYKAVEFDKYAVASYNAVHGTNFEVSDITKTHAEDLEIVDTDKYTYMMTYSFPCQDLSLAGNKQGMTKGSGTRSGLLWEVERIINECKELPQILIMENVTQVHSKRNIGDFEKWIAFLESKGYNNIWLDMNATERNIAQNRKRCFMISTLPGYSFTIPTPIPLTKKMKDYLEPEVEEKFYLSDTMVKGFLKHNEHHIEKGTGFIWKPSDIEGNAKCLRANAALCPTDNTVMENKPTDNVKKLGNIYGHTGGNFGGNVYDKEGTSPALNTMQGGNRQPIVTETVNIRQSTKKGYIECEVGGVADLSYPNSKARRGRVINNGQTSPALMTTASGICKIEDTTPLRIRRLTPKECWRLMGFSDEDFSKAQKVNSNTQLYKQAGNSIVVDCLMAIMNNIVED